MEGVGERTEGRVEKSEGEGEGEGGEEEMTRGEIGAEIELPRTDR